MFIRTAIAVLAAATIVETGAAFAQTAPQPVVPPAATAPATGHRHHHGMAIFRGLNLTPDQTAKIKSIREKHMLAQRQEIMSVLNPEQQQKFQQRIAAIRARREHQKPNGAIPQPTQ